MNKILLVSLILLGCSAKTAPQFELLEGGSIDLQSPQKLVLINYWAIWCAPCRKEIPEFNQLLQEQGDNIAVLAVNFDGSEGQQLRDEIAKLEIEFPSLLKDPRTLWGLEPVQVLPETLVIGRDGQLLHRLIGPQTLESLEALL